MLSVRIVPTHPELTRLLRDHPASFGQEGDGRLFAGVGGGDLPTLTYRRARARARQDALTPAEQASPLARRPCDLRHACMSTLLNGGVYPAEVAGWDGAAGARTQDRRITAPPPFADGRGQALALPRG